MSENIAENKFQINIKTLSNFARTEKWNGSEYLILPAVLLTEGVHNGLYYPVDEIAKFPGAWNNRPVPIHHPQKAGSPISCNSPEVLCDCVGTVFNTKFEDGKLKAELWVDKKKLSGKDRGTLLHLQASKPIDISTGLWSDEIETLGTWNGEPYSAIVQNIRPDHVALLPGQIGACSWKDGCGAPRINIDQAAEGKGNVIVDNEEVKEEVQSNDTPESFVVNEEVQEEPSKSFWERFKSFFKLNKKSHQDIERDLRLLLPQTKNAYNYIVSVYDDYFIYSVEPLEEVGSTSLGMEPKSTRVFKTYKQSYGMNEKGEIVLVGDPVEGEMKADFVPKVNEEHQSPEKEEPMVEAEVKTNEGEKDMSCCVIDLLINDERTQFSEEDREWLKTLDEDKLAKFTLPEIEVIPTETPVEENENEVEPKVNAQEANELSLTDVLASKEFAQAVAMAVKTLSQRDRKSELVNMAKGMKHLNLTEDELYEMPDTALEKIVKINTGDYSGRGGQVDQYNPDTDSPPDPPKILLQKKGEDN